MKKIELVYNEILFQVLEEEEEKKPTQKQLSKLLDISLSTVNYALKPLKDMGAIQINQRNFTIINPKKILLYWASIRNLSKDIVYKTRVNKEIFEIEKIMPADIIFTAYSAYKFMFKDVPADYSEVYVYADDLKEIKKRFPQNNNIPNLFVLKKNKIAKLTIANLFVDLWNLKEWYAKEFLNKLEEKINAILA